jgi:hypothetical protein
MTSVILIIDGKPVDLPGDKAWSLTVSNKPDAVTPAPEQDLAAAIAAAKPGDTVYVGGRYKSKSITVTTPGLKIKPVAPTHIEFDPQGQKDAALFVLDKAKGFEVEDITVSGPAKSDAASYVVRCEGAEDVLIERVKTVTSPAGGMGIAFVRGVTRLDVIDCETPATTVYSLYASAPSGMLVNKNITVRRCKWGKSDSHNMRVYGVKDLVIEDCSFKNPDSASGRQCIKVMNGENVSIRSTNFDGTTRFGRDVNDPSSYALKNCVIQDCNFTDWTRVDPTGGNAVTYQRCKVHSNGDNFVFHLFDKVVLENIDAKYQTGTGGRFANSSKLIVAHKDVTFNGKPI